MNMRINRGWAGMTVLALALGLQGCGGDEDTTALVKNIPVNTPAAIAQESDDNYDLNVNGLITESTLKRWKDDWLNQRPAGITGKLVILQVSAGPAPVAAVEDDPLTTDIETKAAVPGAEYIKDNGINVFTYLSPSSDWVQTRSNGVIETPSMVPDGASMDALLKKYNIDPQNDMIVAAMGTGSTGNAMSQGRIWYALRYWGVDEKNLAILNGGNQWLMQDDPDDPDVELLATLVPATTDFMAAPRNAPGTGHASVKDLLVDNTQLQATVGDLLRVLPASDTNVLNDGVFIWDARSTSQYSAGETSTAGTITPVANYMTTFQNNGSRQGHPWGALQLDFSNMLNSAKGYAYKTKAELQAYMDGNTPGTVATGFIDGSYQHVGVNNAYQPGDVIYTYCETTFRAMITGMVSTVILGLPTRFYDGAMVEWNSLTPGSVITDATGKAILPEDSPWRTDVKSFYRPATSNTLVAQRYITDAYAKSSNAIIDADKAYKYGEVIPTAGTSAPPANPCGG
jgi:3-mercaptopyruvate sulfurtransferase SseA